MKAKAEVKKHATYSASGSDRWLACPGSIALEKRVPKLPDSQWSIEGVRAHECFEIFLKNPGKVGPTMTMLNKKYPQKMVWNAKEAAVMVFKEQEKTGAVLHSERRVHLDFVEPDMFGTLDASITEHFGLLDIYDFKYGAGISVQAKENSQLLYYALGAAHEHEYNFDRVRLNVIQPRISGEDILRSWTTTVEHLLVWREKFKMGVEECKKPKARLFAGKHCRFCAAKEICPEYANKNLREAQDSFSELPVSPQERIKRAFKS